MKLAQRFIAGTGGSPETKSVKRTDEKEKEIRVVIIQPSASRTKIPRTLYPSSKLLGYYHSSARGLINRPLMKWHSTLAGEGARGPSKSGHRDAGINGILR